ncbi:hypothetical protein K5549_009682 [Capra hircus]|nr:hypothetical protein K5549_009682 [Capra hircus]
MLAMVASFFVICPIMESYPSSSPIWFVDSDDPNLTSVLERLEDTKNNNSNGTTEEVTSEEEEEEEMAEDIEDLDHYEMKEEEPISGKKSEDEGIEKENLAILEKIRKTQRQDHLNWLGPFLDSSDTDTLSEAKISDTLRLPQLQS